MFRQRLIFFVLVASAMTLAQVGCSSSSVPAVKPLPGKAGTLAHAHPPHHLDQLGIRVVNGYGEFYNKVGGATFVPRGNNYIRLRLSKGFYGNSFPDHSTFNVGVYNSARAEAALSQMEALGYNVVRVFLIGITEGSMYLSPDGPMDNAYMANVADFLRLAKSHGIRTVITSDDAPGRQAQLSKVNAFANANGAYLSPEGIAADQGFWTDVISGLRNNGAPMDDVFAFELRNELSYDTSLPPFAASVPYNFTPGPVTTADGNTYDTSQLNQWRPMMDSNMANWARQVTQTINGLAPQTFVDIGFFAPNEPNAWRDNTRRGYPYPALSGTNIDFVKMSLYPGSLTLPQLAQNFQLAGNQVKPAMMGEYGAFRSLYSLQLAASTLLDWQLASCDLHFKGWLLWTWDTEEGEQPNGLWTAVDSSIVYPDGVINHALAPAYRPNPCSGGF